MKLKLPRKVQEKMRCALHLAGNREIGGVLMGEQIGPGEFRIVDLSIDDVSGSAAHFVRSIDQHQQALAAFFDRTGKDYARYNYLGEWHSHPRYSTRPSAEDLASMNGLVDGERDISFAVLVIARRRFWRGRLEAASYVFGRHTRPAHAHLELE
jgi:integrative and conjugative element protein (TIGR02256 family)